MSETKGTVVGSLAQIFRYPVKSMEGEELEQVDVTKTGFWATVPMPWWTARVARLSARRTHENGATCLD